ncbi:MAG: hemerythrin family protein, partial [Candidatus Accumulibacter sp.]|nr:hemerythrin family protein [Accumulibacter sp.]
YFARSTADIEHDMLDNQNESRAGEPVMWRHTYQCGEETIDRQHKDLFMYCNSVILAIEDKSLSLDQMPAILDKFVADLSVHLTYEESLLSHLGYPGLDTHRRKHRALLARLQNLHRLAIARELSMDDLVSFVEWNGVVQHMLTDDHVYFPFLKKALQPDSTGTP